MTCPTCQTPVQDGSPFCPRCGTQFSYQQAPPPYPPQQQYPPQGYPQQQQPSYPPQQAPPSYPPPPPQYPGGPQPGGYPPPQYGAQGVNVAVEHGASFALAVVTLQPEQSIQAESGAMVSMSANVELQSQMKGGLMGALKRAVVGESVFISTFTAHGGPGEVTLAPGPPGDIVALTLSNQAYFVQSGSFLAAAPSVKIDTKLGGAKSFFSGEGLFLIGASGNGPLVLSSFGAIRKKTLQPGEQYIVDTGHIVAFESTVQYQVQKAAAGFFRSMTSGEGLVARYTGPGDIYLQTRNLEAFAGVLKPFFPAPSSGGGGGFSFGS
jgi:uncharacterized protein (TIGR00266 family)